MPHVVETLYDFLSSVRHKRRHIEECFLTKQFWLPMTSSEQNTVPQKKVAYPFKKWLRFSFLVMHYNNFLCEKNWNIISIWKKTAPENYICIGTAKASKSKVNLSINLRTLWHTVWLCPCFRRCMLNNVGNVEML